MSAATAEIKFVNSFLVENLWKPPPLSSLLREDITGTILITKNLSVGHKTKFVHIRTRLTNIMVQEGIIKVIFIRSADNPADGMTKNLPSAIHGKFFVLSLILCFIH
jgi:uracil phosphoribosyltransferase